MSEFKFNQPERHNVERLLQQVRHMGLSVIEGVDRIEQIISARGESDGWVRVEDGLPEGFWSDTDQEYYKKYSEQVNVCADNGAVGTAAFNRETQKWFMNDLSPNNYREFDRTNVTHWKPLPSPPKPDQK